MSDYILPETRWHVPGDDCPVKSAFLDQLTGRRAAAPPEPMPEPRRCARPGCAIALPYDLRDNALYCSRECGCIHRSSRKGAQATGRIQKHAGQCRKCGTARKPGTRCAQCRSVANAKQRAKKQHPDVMAAAYADGFAEAVGVRA